MKGERRRAHTREANQYGLIRCVRIYSIKNVGDSHGEDAVREHAFRRSQYRIPLADRTDALGLIAFALQSPMIVEVCARENLSGTHSVLGCGGGPSKPIRGSAAVRGVRRLCTSRSAREMAQNHRLRAIMLPGV